MSDPDTSRMIDLGNRRWKTDVPNVPQARWLVSKKGNVYANILRDGVEYVVVIQNIARSGPDRFMWSVLSPLRGTWTGRGNTFDTEDAAKCDALAVVYGSGDILKRLGRTDTPTSPPESSEPQDVPVRTTVSRKIVL